MNTRDHIQAQAEQHRRSAERHALKAETLEELLAALDAQEQAEDEEDDEKAEAPPARRSAPRPSANGPVKRKPARKPVPVEEEEREYVYPSGFTVGQPVRYAPVRGQQAKYPANGLSPGTALIVVEPQGEAGDDGVFVSDGHTVGLLDAMCLHEA